MKRQQWKLGTAVIVSLGLVGGVAHMATADTGTPQSQQLPPANGSVALSAAELTAATPSTASGLMRPGGAAQPRTAAAVASAVAAAAPTSAKLSIKGVYQNTNYKCVPTSSAVSLGTFGISVSQDTLATKMGTTTSGTWDKTALPVINSYINPLAYSVWDTDTTGNATNLLNWIAYDIGTLKRAPKLGIWFEKLPWNKGASHSGHAILAYGYDLSAKTVTVWDPWKPTGGTHTLSAATLNAAMQAGGLSYLAGHSDADLTNAGDLSGDGRADMIAVYRPTGTLYRYTNNGKGSFDGGSSAVKLGTGWNSLTELAGVGDLTGDKVPDVAAVEKSTGKLWLYRGPSLAASTRILIGTGGWNSMRDLIGIGNITGDSHPDLVAMEKSTGKLWVYPGKANGLGTRVQLATSWTTKMAKLSAVGDLSRDGKPDLVAVDTSTGKLYLYKGPTFRSTSRVLIGSGWNGMRSLTGVGDMTADGIPDLIAVANTAGDMYLYPGKASALGTRIKQGGGWNG
jgi:hypothetical protein